MPIPLTARLIRKSQRTHKSLTSGIRSDIILDSTEGKGKPFVKIYANNLKTEMK